jgi:hypothetical protein
MRLQHFKLFSRKECNQQRIEPQLSKNQQNIIQIFCNKKAGSRLGSGSITMLLRPSFLGLVLGSVPIANDFEGSDPEYSFQIQNKVYVTTFV